MKKIIAILFYLILFLLINCSGNNESDTVNIEWPLLEKGKLLLTCGPTVNICKKFIECADGEESLIILIPSAKVENVVAQIWDDSVLFAQAGANNIKIFHTWDRNEADSPEFVKPLENAYGVWFSGGYTWRLADAYVNTLTHKKLEEILLKGGVIGGSSAGASILGSYLMRGGENIKGIMTGYQEGFGFLCNTVIDTHIDSRNRYKDIENVLKNKPELIGLGLEDESITVISGDYIEIIGSKNIILYKSHKNFITLHPGDKYDIKNDKLLESIDNNRDK